MLIPKLLLQQVMLLPNRQFFFYTTHSPGTITEINYNKFPHFKHCNADNNSSKSNNEYGQLLNINDITSGNPAFCWESGLGFNMDALCKCSHFRVNLKLKVKCMGSVETIAAGSPYKYSLGCLMVAEESSCSSRAKTEQSN